MRIIAVRRYASGSAIEPNERTSNVLASAS